MQTCLVGEIGASLSVNVDPWCLLMQISNRKLRFFDRNVVWQASDGEIDSFPVFKRWIFEGCLGFDGVFHLGVCLVLGRQRYVGLAGCAME